ncbi:TATA-box binding protein-like protein [Parathielavia appendiculata]|uniref:TATA-box binding protein-like protein n=1 Tax=Parathielavia appendiculata TaxID=2587402 RepID=A0AAN6Z568_9PEZI|nr:TATA-box binding protein-like protein [Parathielavia appendiculata]
MPPSRQIRSQSISSPEPPPQYQSPEPWRDRIRPNWPMPQIQNVITTVNGRQRRLRPHVVTGAKSVLLARLAAPRHARAPQKCGFQSKSRDFKVQNFVTSVSCGFHIRLEGIERLYRQSVKYEPELFPGLVYTVVRPQVKCLVSTTGKALLTGAKREEDVYEAFVKLYPILLEFKKGDPWELD